MKLSSQGLVLSGALDVRHRFIRAIALLEGLATASKPSTKVVIESMVNGLRQELGNYVEQCQLAVVLAQAPPGRDDPVNWESKAFANLAAAAAKGFQRLDFQQKLAFPYVAVDYSLPADVEHFLFRAMGLSLSSPSHRSALALYPAEDAEWGSMSVPNISKDSIVAAVDVPFVEARTPIRWPLLAHEVAHHIAFQGRQAEALVVTALARLEHSAHAPSPGVVTEVIADREAERSTGVSYALALALEGYLDSYEKHSKPGYPTIRQRIASLKLGSAIVDYLPNEWHLDGDRIGENGEPESSSSPTDLQMQAAKQLADELVPQPETTRPEVVKAARDLIRAGEPFGSVPRSHLVSHDEASNEGVSPAAADVPNPFYLASDCALTDAEILEASWAETIEQSPKSLVEAIITDIADDEGSRLDHLDVRLSRSLQSAAVHRWLEEWDENIAGHLSESTVPADMYAAYEKVDARFSAVLPDLEIAQRLSLPIEDPKRLVLRPVVDPDQIGGTTVDLRLGTEWEMMETSQLRSLDPSDDPVQVQDLLNQSVKDFRLTAAQDGGLVLHPGQLVLALSLEYLKIPSDLWGQLEGRSTWARVGLQVHATAGMVDAGFQGYLTFELQNTGNLPLALYPGLRVGQLAFFRAPGVARPYDGKAGAAYSDQARARSAFTKQHEHKARHKFVEAQRRAEHDRALKMQVQEDIEGIGGQESGLDSIGS